MVRRNVDGRRLYTPGVAKRGYNRDTIRGGASDWDVSRPFSSYLRVLGRLLIHPIRFFELLPKVPDGRAPGLFLAFSGVLASLAWLLAGGLFPALAALLLPLPLSLILTAPYHLAAYGGRYGYAVTWRVLAYPFGYLAPLTAVPVVRWLAAAYLGVVLLAVGLSVAKEISFGRPSSPASPLPVCSSSPYYRSFRASGAGVYLHLADVFEGDVLGLDEA